MTETPKSPAPPAAPPDSPPPDQPIRIPEICPALLLNDVLIFPNTIVPLAIASPAMISMVNDALSGHRVVAAFTRAPSPRTEKPEDQFFGIGTAAHIMKMFRMPDGTIRLLVQGLTRIKRTEVLATDPYLQVRIEPLEIPRNTNVQIEGLTRKVLSDFSKYAEEHSLPDEVRIAVHNISDPGALADIVASNLNLPITDRQALLENNDLEPRLTLVATHLARELELLRIGTEIRSKVEQELEENQKEYYLREQLKAIRKELGEESEGGAEIAEFEKRVADAGLPAQAAEAAKKELDRMRVMSVSSAEYSVSRTYIEWLVSLPWNKATSDEIKLEDAEIRLNMDHYGLDEVKTRILEFLAVRKLRKTHRGPILCFAGPPGVGKTSLGQSIAGALNRQFIRMSLGGVRDEAEIRGHRRTYVGAMPGRIMQSIRRVSVNNPVLMLDEIDKLGMDFRGDPASALLEVLDPAQNSTFADHYLDVEFDLSTVFFITTANDIGQIPGPLRDRMEIIEIPSYITDEKIQIGLRYLLPRQREENGLKPSHLDITEEGMRALVRGYTREAGVRKLEQRIGSVCRKIARVVADGKRKTVTLTAKNVAQYLGPALFAEDDLPPEPRVGVALGLAWTPVGGEILVIESTLMSGSGKLQVTGQLGDVMKESAQIALSYMRSHSAELGINDDKFVKFDIHLHVPEGATPKEGPSAGVALALSLASLLTGNPVRNDICMTGEITLSGNVLPVGGIREKIVAAARRGISDIIIPADNEKDLFYVPDHVKSRVRFHPVETVSQVLEFGMLPPKVKSKNSKSKTRRKAVA
ncbi:endopeptidase La [bacterium]|nr:endopeptidase La [bacterium]